MKITPVTTETLHSSLERMVEVIWTNPQAAEAVRMKKKGWKVVLCNASSVSLEDIESVISIKGIKFFRDIAEDNPVADFLPTQASSYSAIQFGPMTNTCGSCACHTQACNTGLCTTKTCGTCLCINAPGLDI